MTAVRRFSIFPINRQISGLSAPLWRQFLLINPEIISLVILKPYLNPTLQMMLSKNWFLFLWTHTFHTHTQLSNKGFRLQRWLCDDKVFILWGWALLEFIWCLFVSLHINRWLCRDNVQHIVPTIMHPCTHKCIYYCACVCVVVLNLSEGHLLISLFQKGSAGAFQVSWAGIPEQTSTRVSLAKNGNNKTKSWFALLSLPEKSSLASEDFHFTALTI